MSGTLIVTYELCWTPAGWIFNNILEGFASTLAHSRPDLSARLLDARQWDGIGYLDLRSDPDEDLRLMLRLLDARIGKMKSGDSRASVDPAYLALFIAECVSLRRMLDAALKERWRKPSTA